jgi:glycosyltransferase involved in cell wall biosynthesis
MISTTLITFNRIEYTKKTITSYLKNTTVSHELIVVDNASTDGTQKYLKELLSQGKIQLLIINPTNLFPGQATNQGFSSASKKAEFLHRSDNDLIYKVGWDKEVIQAFNDVPKMGQLGLINELYQVPIKDKPPYEKSVIRIGKSVLLPPVNLLKTLGGPCVIRREIFDKGILYEKIAWKGPINEDSRYCKAVKSAGYEVYSLYHEKVLHLGYGDINKYFNYYFEVYNRREQLDWFSYRLFMEKNGRIKNGKTLS